MPTLIIHLLLSILIYRNDILSAAKCYWTRLIFRSHINEEECHNHRYQSPIANRISVNTTENMKTHTPLTNRATNPHPRKEGSSSYDNRLIILYFLLLLSFALRNNVYENYDVYFLKLVQTNNQSPKHHSERFLIKNTQTHTKMPSLAAYHRESRYTDGWNINRTYFKCSHEPISLQRRNTVDAKIKTPTLTNTHSRHQPRTILKKKIQNQNMQLFT